MDISRNMVIILFIFTTVRAQTTSNQGDMNPLHPSLAVVLVVLSIMFGVTFIIVAYAKFCHRHAPYPVNQIQDPPRVVRSMSRFSGVDRTIIESLPFFRFSSLKGSKEGLECVVCLSSFEDCEILRLLPKCRHAFHMNCIDKWLEKHSSCPLCRYRFDVEDLKYFTYTNSFRNQQTNHSSEEQQNLEFYIQREENPLQGNSSRFNLATTFQKLSRLKGEEPSIRKLEADRNVRRFQHKIIISDVLQKSRWSEVNSSDLMSLSSDMLNAFSSKRFSTAGTSRDSFNKETLSKEQKLKIKDDIERKRMYESMMISTRTGNVVSDHPSCSSLCAGNVELDEHCGVSRLLDSDQRRSMSDMTNISRFAEFGIKNSSVNGASTHGNVEKNDRIKRLWLPIARRTIQRFASQEKNLLDTHNLGPDHV
ncbi:E3 ubiquitin-protein ligase ATL42-like [Primulina eburnea]|uniref:E3 ubiquitin-protein ligase ATL42-like n=1 Tax=Primulina eburnea TaxID=1245227 RepID=UPI003C6C2D2C